MSVLVGLSLILVAAVAVPLVVQRLTDADLYELAARHPVLQGLAFAVVLTGVLAVSDSWSLVEAVLVFPIVWLFWSTIEIIRNRRPRHPAT
jgi:hypothetical protein